MSGINLDLLKSPPPTIFPALKTKIFLFFKKLFVKLFIIISLAALLPL